MKFYIFPITCFLFIVVANAQSPAKKATVKFSAATKGPVEKKPAVMLKAHFLLRNFAFDPSMFSGTIDTNSQGTKQLNIKILVIKSAAISMSNAAASSISEFTNSMIGSYDSYFIRPDNAGFTYHRNFSSTAPIIYNKENVDLLEYKMIYNGTKSQQELAKAMSLMPKVRNLNEKPGSTSQANEYDTDANNRIMRIYMLRFTPGEDKGFMMLYYEANIAEDRNNDAIAKLQKIVDGITTMNMQEQFNFVAMKDTAFAIDLAMPAGTTLGYDNRYSLKGLIGSLAIKKIADATQGYAKLLENTYVSYGTVINTGDILQYKLYNGLRVFSRTLTIEKNDDAYKSTWYQVVNVVVPDRKILQKPIQVSLTLFSKNSQITSSINAYVLNSISLPGTLTKTTLMKIKDSYVE